MREKIAHIQERIDSDPRLKEAVERIKPKRTLWGVLGIVLFFFIPEIITYIWQPELIDWAHLHSITEPVAQMRRLYAQLETMFKSGVSWLNIGIGTLLLLWVWRAK